MRRFALIAAAALLLYACKADAPLSLYKKTWESMGTYVTITVAAESPEHADRAMDAAFGEISSLGEILSFWRPDSEIGRINASAGRSPQRVSPPTLELTEAALTIASSTDGAFDPTVGPLMRLWDYRAGIIPDQRAIANTLALVDYRKVKVDSKQSSVYLSDAMMSFDTGGIAKGFAADRAVEVLRENGISSGLVAVAGDIRAFGLRPDGMPWRVGIRDPRSEDPEAIIARVDLHDEAISTSGDYERYFIKDGRRYHHIIDPSDGFPAEGTISLTVISSMSVLSDGYSTALFVLGPDKAPAAMERLGLEGVLIDSSGQRYVSPGLTGRVMWVSQE